MKKVYLPILIGSVIVFLFLQSDHAQRIARLGNSTISHLQMPSHGFSITSVTDTLRPVSFGAPNYCGDTAHNYILDVYMPYDSGYAFGNNVFREVACAQKYYATGAVSGALVAISQVAGTTGSTTAKVYAISSATKGPNSSTVLGTSIAKPVDSLVAGYYNYYSFSTNVSVIDSFFISMEFPDTIATANGDTAAIYCTALGCASGDSLSWENFPAFGGWLNTIAAFGTNTDFFILPIIDIPTGVNENYPVSNGLTLMGVYPNPAQSFTTVRYKTDKSTQANINVFDLSGKVYQTTTENVTAGEHQFSLYLKNFASGDYFYTVKTNDATMTSKFSVIK